MRVPLIVAAIAVAVLTLVGAAAASAVSLAGGAPAGTGHGRTPLASTAVEYGLIVAL